MKNKSSRRQRFTRRHKNSPNYARWYEIVNWISWGTFALGFIMFIIGLGLLGSPNDTVHNTDATIVWAIGLGVWVVSIIFSLVLIWIDDDYESQQQSRMIQSIEGISPEDWQQIGNNMANIARNYQATHKIGKTNNSWKKKNK